MRTSSCSACFRCPTVELTSNRQLVDLASLGQGLMLPMKIASRLQSAGTAGLSKTLTLLALSWDKDQL
jgi:uncharacterized protein (DUF2062 family)